MAQTVTATISGFNVIVSPSGWDDREHDIFVVGVIVDSSGNKIGEVDTDIDDTAANLPLALVKAYWLNRQILKGKLVPEAYL